MTPPKDIPTLTSTQLLTALSHATRAHLLKVLSERTDTPRNLAQELDCPIRHVEYHLGILEGLGCVELVNTERSPGGKVIGHHYRALKRFWFDRRSWAEVDPQKQPAFTMDILRLMGEDQTRALLAGMIDKGENHISRTPAIVDEIGYEDMLTLLTDTLDRIAEIQSESAERLQEGGTPIATKVHIVQFLSPDAL